MCTWQMQRDLFRLTEEQRRRDTRYTHHWARLQRRPGARIAALLIRWWPEIPRRRPGRARDAAPRPVPVSVRVAPVPDTDGTADLGRMAQLLGGR